MLNFIFNFQGRTSRKDYWLKLVLPIFAIQIAAFAALFAITAYFWINAQTVQMIISGFGLLLLAGSLAPTVRRFHDVGASGFYLPGFAAASFLFNFISGQALASGADAFAIFSFLAFIVINFVQFYILALMPGTEGDNEFGSDPRLEEHSAEVFA